MGKEVRKQEKKFIVAEGFLRTLIYIGVFLAVLYISRASYHFGYAIFNQEPMDQGDDVRDITVVVDAGDSVYDIGRILEKKGLIEDAKIFVVQELLSNYRGKLQAGTYILDTGMTPDEMMEILAKVNLEGQPDTGASEGSSEPDASAETGEGAAQ
ncbi:MAG TPA: endolytic transglycosylase MltG [Candidatus Blautia merdavium]|uniref:Endolytic transglycosylase MltG n=1 Tax=Candidatus Blautia merdavium TaxID=2838494 RepID=A0A9D2TBB7_9FIRM|nr:endolytic transglycosylase MltG [Candidatus Blautia merdavium]